MEEAVGDTRRTATQHQRPERERESRRRERQTDRTERKREGEDHRDRTRPDRTATRNGPEKLQPQKVDRDPLGGPPSYIGPSSA